MKFTSGQRAALSGLVERAVSAAPIHDIHTHLYDPACGDLLLWGIDDLLGYHYLVAEVFRYLQMPAETWWSLSKIEQSELIWKHLFKENSPISEACRGVITTLQALGLDARRRDLPALRQWFQKQDVEEYTTRCLELAGLEKICMTNSPFDDQERKFWEKGFRRDARFEGALRIDPLLLGWPETAGRLQAWGYAVKPELKAKTISEIRRFLADWTRRIEARYLMVSLGPDFTFPDRSSCAEIIRQAILPHCEEFGIPFALMLGVKRGVNPDLRLAGDGMGRSDLSALRNLCEAHPKSKFLVTVLARENQQELCVLARKFRNLHIFGCWWFTNVPYIVDEMTRMRLELLGLSVTLQHSDARVLDQVIYKWKHSKKVITAALKDKYLELGEAGWKVTKEEVERDVRQVLGGAFNDFCGRG